MGISTSQYRWNTRILNGGTVEKGLRIPAQIEINFQTDVKPCSNKRL